MSTTLFVVIADRNEDFSVIGVFSSPEQAEVVQERLRQVCWQDSRVEEYTVDEITLYFRRLLAASDG